MMTKPKTVTTKQMSKCIQLDKDKVAIVDDDLYPGLMKFHWYAFQRHRSWYARTTIRNGDHVFHINMHRLVAKTEFGMVCHHVNGNTLDNRRSNLQNMTKTNHNTYHANNKIHRVFG